jgi:hypothetical protein
MCILCHDKLPNEIVMKQLQTELDEPLYSKWNTTSLRHITLAAFGINGEEAQNIALLILNKFKLFLKENYDTYHINFEKNGFFKCPTELQIIELISFILSTNKQNNNMCSIEIRHDMNINNIKYDVTHILHDNIENISIEKHGNISNNDTKLKSSMSNSKYINLLSRLSVCGFIIGIIYTCLV